MDVSEEQVSVFVGLDVGKRFHHAVVLGRDGEVLADRRVDQREDALRAMFAALVDLGRVLVVVDQPNTIGALPVAVAVACGCEVAYLPGLSMRRIAEVFEGEAKTDARDAMVIAQTARTMPHALRRLRVSDEQAAALGVLCGFDEDLARQINQVANRIRGLLTSVHPALERVVGPNLRREAIVDVLQRYPSPALLRQAGRGRLARRMRTRSPRIAERLADEIVAAVTSQTVEVAGTQQVGQVIAALAGQLAGLRAQRVEVADQIRALVEAHPAHPILASMPGVGVRSEARIIAEVTCRQFASAGHLAAYAGLAPATRASGISMRGERAARRGNRPLKRAMYLSAFAALKDPTSRAYYDRKRSEGKTHTRAVLALARRRCDVLYAMLRDGTVWQPPIPAPETG